ncbi:hypothetical protein HPB48_021861 [Haemaphysalis longicornis]|uniref:acid phosphatase n=1 Tax=Haemaphysalis longicornis TaxID=44386 RepID=A0A9J6FY28_HAELO|nr:hypothetical protein HPB48_021861 [Haemaphysalis longicornis]
MRTWSVLLVLVLQGVTTGADADAETCRPVAFSCQPQLVHVAILFRHGDRAPCTTFPGDPNQHHVWPMGRGQLTRRGRHSMWALGKWLRARYGHFLSWDPREVSARSSPMPRCFDSAALVLYGLYPARGEEAQLEPGRDWQPVGITRLLDDIDKYAALCLPRLHEAVQELSSLEIPGSDATAPESRSESASRYLRTAGDVLNYVANMTNVSVDPGIPSYIPAWRNLDSLFVTREYALPLPEWALEHLRELDWVLVKSIELVSRSQMDNMAGILIKDVVARMRFGDGRGPSLYQGNHETSAGPKMTLFSYHDLNVAGALLGLNGTMTARPPYGSAVIVEAFTTGATETATRLYVRVLYKAGEQLSEIPIEGCDVPCPVEQFDEFVQWRFRPVSREQCGWSEHQPLI